MRTERVVALGDGLDAPWVQLRKLAQRPSARCLEPLRQQPADARQLPCLCSLEIACHNGMQLVPQYVS